MRTWVKMATAGVAFCAAVFIRISWPPTEPVYQGKTLTAWLRDYERQYTVPFDDKPAPYGEATEALTSIGTNAIPFLLRFNEARGVSIGWEIKKWAGHRNWSYNPKNRRLAWCGFQALGASAQCAVPALTNLLEDSQPERRWAAAVCLSYIGPAAEDAVPALVRKFEDKDTRVRSFAMLTLGRIHARPELAVPALTRVLETPAGADSFVRDDLIGSALWALKQYREEAKPALSTVRPLTGDPNYSVRWFAEDCLKEILAEGANNQAPTNGLRQ